MTKKNNLWHIKLNDGDWFYVFAKSEKEAIRILIDIHYDMQVREFKKEYKPLVSLVPSDKKISVLEDTGEVTKTAAEWVVDEVSGPFCSNTYLI